MQPVRIHSQAPLAAAVIAWRLGGHLRATLVVKATVRYSEQSVELVTNPHAISPNADPSTGRPGDLAPYLRQAQVVCLGRIQESEGRLRIQRGARVLLDKTGAMGASFGAVVPPATADGYGPDAFAHGVVTFARGLDGGRFSCAPADQQLDGLEGDEAVTLQGVDARAFALHFTLPGLTATAEATGPAGTVDCHMKLDTLIIEPAPRLCSLVWRGAFASPDEATLAATQVNLGLRLANDAGERFLTVAEDVDASGTIALSQRIPRGGAARANKTLPFKQQPAAAPPVAADLHGIGGASGTQALDFHVPKGGAPTPAAAARAPAMAPTEAFPAVPDMTAGATTTADPAIAAPNVPSGETAQLSREAFRQAAAAQAHPFGAGNAPATPRPAGPVPGAPWSDAEAPVVQAPLPGDGTLKMGYLQRPTPDAPPPAAQPIPASAPEPPPAAPISAPKPTPEPKPEPEKREVTWRKDANELEIEKGPRAPQPKRAPKKDLMAAIYGKKKKR